tara:strand:- start:3299 stop:3541 length:243 start_codon:yes stop_codon:yes gene_type:complete
MHRLFYKSFDLYMVSSPLDKNNRDYHWRLESKSINHVIDLAEEQYINQGIKFIKNNLKKANALSHAYAKNKLYGIYYYDL